MTSTQGQDKDVSFAETALRLGGKSEDEATRTGAMDRADDQVEAMFAPQYKTVNSPIHKAVWETDVPIDLFRTPKMTAASLTLPAMTKSLDLIKKYKKEGKIWDEQNKVATSLLEDLGPAGYWGMFIDKKHGGQGSTVRQFMNFLAQVALIDPTTAGLASVHGCIGAVDPLQAFGTDEQKARLLPRLASGEALSAFALTEPCAGSDLTALRTTAVLKGDKYVINGEKLFITNAVPGRMVGIVCNIDGKPAAIIADLPKQENEHFKIHSYGLHALKHAYNQGLIFKDFEVPKENLLIPPIGDGLTIAYHGLNLGRLALCAASTGVMRTMLANMLPWSKFRETYGQPIQSRELVKRRIARTASLIVGAEALYNWGSDLLDKGYRGELECVIAKIFGSEAQKEVAIELFMKTHGGRSFVHGHPFGDNVHDFLAPCIYEGEGEVLGMAFFKSLAKAHGQQFFEPIGKTLAEHKLRTLNPLNPAQVWLLRNQLIPYAAWRAGKMFEGSASNVISGMSERLQMHVDFAQEMLNKLPLELSENMVKHQLKLADRQCRIAEMSQRVQDTIVILVTALYAHEHGNDVYMECADLLCQDLTRKLTGERPSDEYFKACSKLADRVISGEFPGLSEVETAEILLPYDKKNEAATSSEAKQAAAV
ncbi:MAG: acyl-CoA dehydrogenase family protein [Candidatus Obscuribacterales bacterium]|nr:acyl-CoA dehydrogenase family protein [Candidatus Obscuribacterales bacterium]